MQANHLLRDALAEEEWPLEIDAENALPAFLGRLQKIAATDRRDAGVVDQHIDAPPFAEDRADDALAIGGETDVPLAQDAWSRVEKGLRLARRGRVAVIVDGDREPRLRQR